MTLPFSCVDRDGSALELRLGKFRHIPAIISARGELKWVSHIRVSIQGITNDGYERRPDGDPDRDVMTSHPEGGSHTEYIATGIRSADS